MTFFCCRNLPICCRELRCLYCVDAEIRLRIPLVSSPMDTVTESRTAITIAQMGGIGFIHRNLSIEGQAAEVAAVRIESGMIVDPVTVIPSSRLARRSQLMKRYGISGLPVVTDERLVGILTNRDLRFERRLDQLVRDVMTSEVITARPGISLDHAKELLQAHRIEKLPLVDDHNRLRGLITVKDMDKATRHPIRARIRWDGCASAPRLASDRSARSAWRRCTCGRRRALHRYRSRSYAKRDRRASGHQERMSGYRSGRGQRRDQRRSQSTVRRRRRRVACRHGPRLDLHDAHGLGRRRAADHRYHGLRRGRGAAQYAGDRGRRYPVFRRYHQGARGGRVDGDDRLAVRRHRGEPRRDDSLPGPHLQALSRHGFARRDDRTDARPLRTAPT